MAPTHGILAILGYQQDQFSSRSSASEKAPKIEILRQRRPLGGRKGLPEFQGDRRTFVEEVLANVDLPGNSYLLNQIWVKIAVIASKIDFLIALGD